MIIVDTCIWIYLFDKKSTGKCSVEAKQFYTLNQEPLAVTDLIIDEMHKWLVHHRFTPKNALQILNGFVAQEFAQIIPIDEKDRVEANQLVEKYLDQQFSYTDAITVALMKRVHIKKIFSFDSDFDLIRGIERVPKK